LGLISGLIGETILFVDRQCERIESALKDDFRVVLTLKDDLDEGKQEILEDRLRALDGVEEVQRVSAEEALDALKHDDPELVDSVGILGGNPLPVSYEVRLTDHGLGRISQWISQAEPLAEWGDILYKPEQAQAILQAQFYGHLISLVIDASVCLVAMMALLIIWSRAAGESHPHSHHPHAPSHHQTLWAEISPWISSAAVASGAALIGTIMVFFLAIPMRGLNPWWIWPSAGAQILLVAVSSVFGLVI
jgi:hypothetical protein